MRSHIPFACACLVGAGFAPGTSLAQGQVARVSVATGGAASNGLVDAPSISGDGRFVAFASDAPDLVANDLNATFDVFVHDRLTTTTTRVSLSSAGLEGNGASTHASISEDGRYVAFASTASNLDVADANGASDVFVHDRVTGVTKLLSRNLVLASASGSSFSPAISGDGAWVLFYSSANDLDPLDGSAYQDAFFVERATGAVSIASVNTVGGPGDFHTGISPGVPGGTGLSRDGRMGVFVSLAGLDPVDGNGTGDVYVRDRVAGTTRLVSVDALGNASFPESSQPAISGNGRHVVFYSSDPDFVPGDTNGALDVFVRDLWTNATERVNVDGFGAQVAYVGPPLVQLVGTPSISHDGAIVAFETAMQRLVPGDTGNRPDVFVRDRRNGVTQLASRGVNGGPGNLGSARGAVSADGTAVAFQSDAVDLVPFDTNAKPDVFVSLVPAPLTPFCFGDGTGTACPCGNSGAARSGCANSSAASGARLVASGRASVTDDTLTLLVRDLAPATIAAVFQGDATLGLGLGVPFGDGLRCAGGNLVRLGNRAVPSGTLSFGHTVAGDPDVSIAGLVPTGGAVRHYQVLYRDTAIFCGAATFNQTNGLTVPWAP